MKLIKFNANKDYPDVLLAAKDLLKRIEEGEVIGFCLVEIQKDSSIGTQYTDGVLNNIFASLGGVTYLKKRLLDKVETP